MRIFVNTYDKIETMIFNNVSDYIYDKDSGEFFVEYTNHFGNKMILFLKTEDISGWSIEFETNEEWEKIFGNLDSQ